MTLLHLEKKLNGVRSMSYSSSLTFDTSDKGRYACACVISFTLSLISTSMFSKYFKIFVNENNVDPLYQKFQKWFSYSPVTVSW